MPHVPPTKVLRGLAAFAFVDDVSIAVLDNPVWTDEDVVAYLDEITTLGKRVPARASISEFRGAMFGARERKIVLDWLARENISAKQRNCLLTSSALLRGAVTAYAWMTGTEGTAFDPHDRANACAWITQGASARPTEVERALVRCYELLGLAPP